MKDEIRERIAEIQAERLDGPNQVKQEALQEELGWLVLRVVWRGYQAE